MIKGKIRTTWTKAGGEAKFGAEVEDEVKIQTWTGRNVYRQRFTHGVVYWDATQGGKTWTYPGSASLPSISNDRDALARYGFRPGALLRSAKLSGISTNDARLVTAEMQGGLILDLRTPGTAAEPKFPYGDISQRRISIPAHADYARYVTGTTERKAFATVLNAIAAETGPVWIHCTAGKDRTGWTTVVLMSILSIPSASITAEYLRSAAADVSDLKLGLSTVAKKYGTANAEPGVTFTGMGGYVRTGLGLSAATVAALRSKAVAALS